MKSKSENFGLLGKNIMIFSIFAIYAVIQAWRGWDVFRLGRFWGEDGSMLWAYSLTHSPLEVLGFIAPIAGYFMLNANLEIFIAMFFPISMAPYIVTILSVILMMLPALFVLWVRPRNLNKNSLNFLVFALLLGPGIMSAEAFGNAINGQTYLGVYSVLVLVFWPDWLVRRKQVLIVILLSIAMLSGWYSIILAPLFMIRSRITPDSFLSKYFRWAPLLFLGLQAYAYIITDLRDLHWPERTDFSSKWFMPIVNLILLPGKAFFGDLNITGYCIAFVGFAFFLVVVRTPSLSFRNVRDLSRTMFANDTLLCLLSLILEITLIGLGQTGRSFGERYLVVPSGIFFILLVLLVQQGTRGARAANIQLNALGIILVIGMINFVRIPSPILNCEFRCISWVEQLSLHDSDSSTLVTHWPYNEGLPNFATNLDNPQVRLAPFQAEALKRKNLEVSY